MDIRFPKVWLKTDLSESYNLTNNYQLFQYLLYKYVLEC
jgi:hypothetical protein